MIWRWISRGDAVDSLTKTTAVFLTGLVAISAVTTLLGKWFADPTSSPQAMALAVALILLLLLTVNWAVGAMLGVTPFGIVLWIGGKLAGDSGSATGREIFESGTGDTLRRAIHRDDDETVLVDTVRLRDPYESAVPQIMHNLSVWIWGQTRQGKSEFAKVLAAHWPDGVTVAHALSSGKGSENEFEEFYKAGEYDVQRFSTEGSTHRWDPFLDYEESIGDYREIAQSVFHANEVKGTGWDEPAKMMILAALVVTGAEYDDFAYFKEVMGRDAESIVDSVGEIEAASGLHTRLTDMEDSQSVGLNRAYQVLLPLLETDLFDTDLPRVSFREVFMNAGDDRVLVLDSIRSATAARGYWRFLIETAIDLSYEVDTEQRFLLDEVDKLPRIHNLGELMSAGASDNSRGIVICQNKGQMDRVYGENEAETIWSNAPNRVTFNAGDAATAEKAIKELGKYELIEYDVSTGPEGETVSETTTDKYPMPTSTLTNLNPGEALIQSSEGWWLCDLTEYDFENSDDGEDS
jgi:hypothetical protein